MLEKWLRIDARGKRLPYRLLLPECFDHRAPYPVVLFLHGGGERGDDNEAHLIHGVPEFLTPENRRRYPCFLAAPQCPAEDAWVGPEWHSTAFNQSADPTEPMRDALDLVGALRREFRIDTRRIYVTGFSMGGFGTWDALARRPDLFAAGVPVCGGGDQTTAPQIAHIPVWAFHGALDPLVPPEASRSMIDALRKAGAEPRYTEYSHEEHACWVPAYRDPELFRWLFAQRKGP